MTEATRTATRTGLRVLLAAGLLALLPACSSNNDIQAVDGAGGAPAAGGAGGSAAASGAGGAAGAGATGGAGGTTSTGGSGGSTGAATLLWQGSQNNISATLAADANDLYVGSLQGIYKVAKDGSGATQLASGFHGEAVAVGPSKVCWTKALSDGNQVVQCANKDGTGVQTASGPQLWYPKLQVDSSYVYWTQQWAGNQTNGLYRARFDGSDKKRLTSHIDLDFVLSGGKIFGENVAGVYRVDADGTGEARVVQQSGLNWGLVADTQLFFASNCNGGTGQCNKLYRAELDGSHLVTLNPFTGAIAIAADAQHIYFSSNGDMYRANRDGSSALVVTNAAGVMGDCLVVDNSSVYWLEPGQAGVVKLMRHAK